MFKYRWQQLPEDDREKRWNCGFYVSCTFTNNRNVCFKMLVLTKLNKNGLDLFSHESKHYDFVRNQLSFVALIQHNKFLRTKSPLLYPGLNIFSEVLVKVKNHIKNECVRLNKKFPFISTFVIIFPQLVFSLFV